MYMGRPSKKLELTAEQEKALKRGYEAGKGHAYRKRCQMMLLKSEARSSEDIAKIVDSGAMSMAGSNAMKLKVLRGYKRKQDEDAKLF